MFVPGASSTDLRHYLPFNYGTWYQALSQPPLSAVEALTGDEILTVRPLGRSVFFPFGLSCNELTSEVRGDNPLAPIRLQLRTVSKTKDQSTIASCVGLHRDQPKSRQCQNDAPEANRDDSQ